MPTNRTPIDRPVKQRFTTEVISAFRKMQQLDRGCDESKRLDELLTLKLWIPPWEDLRRPDGDTAEEDYTDGEKLYCELEEAMNLQ